MVVDGDYEGTDDYPRGRPQAAPGVGGSTGFCAGWEEGELHPHVGQLVKSIKHRCFAVSSTTATRLLSLPAMACAEP